MLNLNERGSNLLPLVHIMLIEWFSLFLGAIAKKMRNSVVLMESKALGQLSMRKRCLMKGQGPKKQKERAENSAQLVEQ